MPGEFLNNLIKFVEEEHKITEGRKLFNEFLNSKYPHYVHVQLVDHSEKGCYLKLAHPFPSYLESHLILNIKGSTAKITEKLPLDANTLEKEIAEPFKKHLQKLKETNDPVYKTYQNHSKSVFEERKQMQNEDFPTKSKENKVLAKSKKQTLFNEPSTTEAPSTSRGYDLSSSTWH